MILENISKDSPAYSEELFGPVFLFFKASSNDEAIEIANDNIYGLAAVIFGKDINNAKKLALKIESGQVYINELV
jgi:succinate-semialdehyde dehydrogenase/glutarate-semialdehyde dehydrogenase